MASIDVSEILRASTTSLEPSSKRSRPSDPEPQQRPNVNTATANPEDILAALEQDSSQAVPVDETHIKKLTSQLEKKTLKNREMRTKHSDDPKKFMDSEIELDTAVQEMHVLATQPDLYGCFVEAGGPSLMLSLLAHENSDILGATVNLLQELTDVDILNEGEEGAAQLIESLASGRIVESFLTAFEKLDEKVKDDADAIHNALSVVENMIDFRPETAEDCVSQNLFLWLLRRACQKGQFDANKMYASELVALLLQMSESAKRKLTEKVDGIDMLLRALAAYKRHDPESMDEREHMENLFDALCAALMLPANRGKFLDGLRTLFPLYMRTPSKVKRKDTTPDEHEEHVCAILASLFRSCGDEARQRMMSKFVEHEHEKIDRAIELFIKYREKLAKFEAKRARREDSSVDEDVDRDYLDRLDAGLYTLQNLSLILADVCAHTSSARHRASKLFSMKMKQEKVSKVLLPLLTEYQANVGDGGDEERRRIDLLIARLTKSDREKDKE
ncbi:Eukaryotic hypothetical protein [Necator americanus]|uniref:Beta-catenin-like protein 1 n=1 Tax=Necator americanus TaxID=51031 RepID=W2T0C9_NECAM|nr:Eukaryotic hypothetical protein [Necator americanus]ETN75338.1 Eukaryotic hypothetical protein [Necator americanus]